MKKNIPVVLSLYLIIVILTSGCIQESGEPVEIPDAIEANCMGFLIGNPDEEMQTARQAGAGWARPHPGPFAWEFIEPVKGQFVFTGTDEWVISAQENNMAILGTIWPYADWDQSKCHGIECEVGEEDEFHIKTIPGEPPMPGIPLSRCVPCGMGDYGVFVSALVERYDGDGIDDMPGLEIPIKYWEILNEPEEGWPTLTFFIGTHEEYFEILKHSSEAIKSACPDCMVVQGGAQHSMQYNLEWWEDLFDLGGADYFGIANVHYITEGDLDTLNVANFKSLMQEKGIDKPIWVTEAQYNSEDEVEDSVEGALAAGASKIFFTQFNIGEFGVPVPGEYSLIYDSIPEKCNG